MDKKKKATMQTMLGKHERIVTVLALLKVTQERVRALKHGYIADDEFAELRKLIQKI